MRDLQYATVNKVIASWDECKRRPNFDVESLETIAFLKLFELEPRTKRVFGLKDGDECSEDFIKSGKLPRAIGIFAMLDGALSMYVISFVDSLYSLSAIRLGPDTETLVEILNDLGKRHVGLGVKAHYYPYMGQAIFHAIRDVMGNKWTKELEEAWQDVYDELSSEMMKSTLLHIERMKKIRT